MYDLASAIDHASGPLLRSIKDALSGLEALLIEVNHDRVFENCFYRFYHQSFKVYHLQADTEKIVEALRRITPERKLDPWFEKIVAEGTGKTFALDHNPKFLN